ncbi:ferric reduction oxidase 2 [Fagus crenata]
MDRVRVAIRLLSMIVILWIILIWIMMPTGAYGEQWWPNIKATVNSTYFGGQGAMMLIFTFPVLFVASLGCIYLHLVKKLNDNKKESKFKFNRFAVRKRPLLVKGSLGIVSNIELALFSMFIVLLVWSLANYIHNYFAKINPESAAKKGLEVWQNKLDVSGLAFAVVGNIALSFIFYPVARGSSVLPLFGLTSEASIKYHMWLENIVVILFTAHGLCYITFWGLTKHINKMLRWDFADVANLAGEIALLILLIMRAMSIPHIRRNMFELFYYTNHLYFLIFIFFIFHVGFAFACISLPGFYIFLVDRYLRFLQSRQKVCLTSARILPCVTVELNFSKSLGLNYNPTSTIFINVPSISKLQWHPFTITSSSNLDPKALSVVIKDDGSWTKKLYELLSSPMVSVEGPYGPASTNFLRHDTLVMVSGGSGITPFISIIRDLIFTSATLKCKIPNLILVASFKNSLYLTMLDVILPISGTPFDISHLHLQIEAFVTREKEPKPHDKKLIKTVWFKAHPTDAPISTILGPNSWLWLGAIIASSFVIFLILTGIITRYYVYPIDNNTGAIFSWSLESVVYILVVCFSIAITASAAVLQNKKKNSVEAKQMGTPSFYNADRELESLPHQSLGQATNVHYGERPNLKRMLLECKGSSVGVLVCGPKKLMEEVATICGSDLAENLHFESYSFSW